MGDRHDDRGGTRRSDWAILGAILVLAAAIRWPHLTGRELWLDETTRVRMSLLSWDGAWDRLAYLDPIKSPYLVLFHKAWTAVVGTGTILAMRGYGGLLGVALVAAAWFAARAACGRRAALVAALVFAADPFYVRHSIEIHTYGPAMLLVMAIWALVLGAREISRRRALAVLLLGGVAVGTFPALGLSLAPLCLVPAVRRFRNFGTLAAGFALSLALALPPVLRVHASTQVHASAYTAGIAWSPYFNVKTTPWEVLARIGGVDVRQGGATWAMRAGVLFVCTGLVVVLMLTRPPAGEREGWWKRAALLASGLVPPVALCVISRMGVSVFNDRYLHATASTLPIAFVAAIEHGVLARGRGAAGRAAAVLAGAIAATVAGSLAVGVAGMAAAGDAFPKDTASYRYVCNGTFDAMARRDGTPPLVLVHGEAQATQMLIRCDPALFARTDVRHLTTRAWVDAEGARDFGKVAIPHAYGWPFGLTELAGRSISIAPDDAGALVRTRGAAWVVLERERVNRQRQLEDEETPLLDEAIAQLDRPPGAERDRRATTAVLRYLGLPGDSKASVEWGPSIAVVKIDLR